MSIEMAKLYVYKNIKTGKYLSLYNVSNIFSRLYDEKEVSNVEKAFKLNDFTYYPYLPNLDSNMKMLPYEQELRKQKLKELNKNWFQKLTSNFR
jgi:hypothetical protein